MGESVSEGSQPLESKGPPSYNRIKAEGQSRPSVFHRYRGRPNWRKRGLTMESAMNRRAFLGAAAAGIVAISARRAQADEAVPSFDREVDVLIIGGGGTGVAAAVEAAEAGVETLVIEKSGVMGGSTIMSGGMIHAAGTSYQKEMADCDDDSPELLAQYYLGCGDTLVDEELVRDMAYASADELAWCESCGIRYVTVFGVQPIPGLEDCIRPRIHLPGDGTTGTAGVPGLGYLHVNPIWARAEKAGATMEFETTAKRLLADVNGAVVSAEVEQDGVVVTIGARRGVVLATSGFDHNVEMAKAMSPSQYIALTEEGNLVGTCATNTGDGIRMGLQVGAGLAGMGGALNVSLNGCIGRDPTSNVGGPTTGITVNRYGQRFVNEWTQYGYYMAACLEQDGHEAWTITDQAAVDREGGVLMGFTSEDLSVELEAGSVVKADTVEELAVKIGVDAVGLGKTLDTWNADVAQGADLSFGKMEALNPINQGPFYAARVLSYNLGSLGGLKINVDAQVCRFDGTPIDRLYAGGLCTGGWTGMFYPGSGTAVLSTVHWGRKAGKAAAAQEPLW